MCARLNPRTGGGSSHVCRTSRKDAKSTSGCEDRWKTNRHWPASRLYCEMECKLVAEVWPLEPDNANHNYGEVQAGMGPVCECIKIRSPKKRESFSFWTGV